MATFDGVALGKDKEPRQARHRRGYGPFQYPIGEEQADMNSERLTHIARL